MRLGARKATRVTGLLFGLGHFDVLRSLGGSLAILRLCGLLSLAVNSLLRLAIGGLELLKLVVVLPQSFVDLLGNLFFLFLCSETQLQIRSRTKH